MRPEEGKYVTFLIFVFFIPPIHSIPGCVRSETWAKSAPKTTKRDGYITPSVFFLPEDSKQAA
jgi:hypothetical protein